LRLSEQEEEAVKEAELLHESDKSDTKALLELASCYCALGVKELSGGKKRGSKNKAIGLINKAKRCYCNAIHIDPLLQEARMNLAYVQQIEARYN